ncbi:heavy metal sensor histidine kinase [Hydrogenophaga sp. PAMC20947]|uniref:heavy metal sensor histidine kinase n=1 Tax=Hydrogenophaga sp. PAMC20947 TaxID=2565558 RepID=UPI00109D8643|nr:heavy metal sensor histidine kinase [Hydrogenophaga sp. PAMC20947]QCB46034.1 heavy metal sensor histidine kinase [Hydrogenophaga sp. PAMC20947]
MSARLTLTARLTLLYTAASLLVLCGLGILVMRANHAHFIELDQAYLEDKVALVSQVVASSANREQLTQRLKELHHSHTGLYLRLEIAGKALYSEAVNPFPPDLKISTVDKRPSDWLWQETTLRGLTTTIAPPPFIDQGASQPLRLMLAMDTHHHTHFMDDLRESLMLYLLAAALASGLLAWWSARRGLAPLRDMQERARRVTAHQLDERMPEASVPVEMAELARELNTMLARLQRDFQRLTEFSSDLAHELRTPISNLLTQTQVTLAHQRDTHAYRDTLASNAEEFQRLGRMVSDMLLLAKTEHGLALPHREPVSLRAQVQALLDFYDVVADEKGITLVLEGEATTSGDKLMLRRAISNLLSNAIRHAPTLSRVTVKLSQVEGEAMLCVENAGPAIDPVHLPRLFDRFYRVDKSRLHLPTEGTGLGLAITQAIMTAHGGSVTVESENDSTRFCLCWPAH